MWVSDLIIRLVGQIVELPLMLYFGFSFLCMVLYFIFANLAVFKSLKQPELILGETLTTEKLKYENSTLTSAESEQILKQLLEYMQASELEMVELPSLPQIGLLCRRVGVQRCLLC